jgi:hypothetical protein
MINPIGKILDTSSKSSHGEIHDRPLASEAPPWAMRTFRETGAKTRVAENRQFISFTRRESLRLGLSSPLLGFQGCRAARHDDHIHIQVKR